jgi:hypothetical protein
MRTRLSLTQASGIRHCVDRVSGQPWLTDRYERDLAELVSRSYLPADVCARFLETCHGDFDEASNSISLYTLKMNCPQLSFSECLEYIEECRGDLSDLQVYSDADELLPVAQANEQSQVESSPAPATNDSCDESAQATSGEDNWAPVKTYDNDAQEGNAWKPVDAQATSGEDSWAPVKTYDNDAQEGDAWRPVNVQDPTSIVYPRVKTRGKILLISPTNSGVDNLVLEAKQVYDGVCDHLNIPRVPVVRLHSPNVENRALFEQLNPSFEDGPTPSRNIDINVLVEAELAALIQRRYLEARKGSDYRNIRDRRFKEAMCSESRYVLELAGVLDMSEEIRNVFTADELVEHKAILSDLTEASEAFDELGDRLTPEWRKRIAKAAKLGLQIMMMHAPVIACTTSVMLEGSVIALVQPHIFVGDEMARDIESKTAGIYSCYPSTEFRVLVGDLLQIPPQMFVTDDRAVVFQQQRLTPMFLRFYKGGFPVKELVETYRYKNQAILDLVKTVYPRPIVAAEGAFDNDLTSRMCRVNDKLYKTPSPVVFLNLGDTHERVNSTGSKYCLETAHVSIFDALEHAKYLPPDSVWILSPYRAQVHILKESLDYLSIIYKKRGDTKSSTHAANLAKSVATIDTFMGRDSTHIVLDLTTPSGHTFDLFARGRVGCTRQKVSFTIVGDATQINQTTRISSSSPVKRAMIHCSEHKIMYEILKQRIETVFPMKPVFTALGYIAGKDDAVTKIANLAGQFFHGYNADGSDSDELEDVPLPAFADIDIEKAKFAATFKESDMKVAQAADRDNTQPDDDHDKFAVSGGLDGGESLSTPVEAEVVDDNNTTLEDNEVTMSTESHFESGAAFNNPGTVVDPFDATRNWYDPETLPPADIPSTFESKFEEAKEDTTTDW